MTVVAVAAEGAAVPALGLGSILLCRFHAPTVCQAFGQVFLVRDLCQSTRRNMRCFPVHRRHWSMLSC